ncbi:tyrosine-type recombinase/integrase [Phytomonospora sp. NPDC050363]|uniref:tyrosine-type recombinase/integrase n=1 Tax=Phytomonospora sp. NPDC050363 TaxID=3155642 RepID=UPI0033F7AAD9
MTGVVQQAVERFTASLRDAGRPANTVRGYGGHAAGFAAFADEGGLEVLTDAAAAEEAVADYRGLLLERGRSTATINAHMTAISAFLADQGPGPVAIERGRQVHARRLPERDVEAFLASADQRSPRDAAIAFLLRYTGISAAQAGALAVGDVDVAEQTLRVDDRVIALHAKATARLRGWLAVHPGAGDASAPLFPTSDRATAGRAMSANSVEGIVRECAGGNLVTVKALSGDLAAQLRDRGADRRAVEALFGAGVHEGSGLEEQRQALALLP